MKNTRFFILSASLSFLLLITSCNSISDDAEKFVGEWKFCYIDREPEQNNYWLEKDVQTISLKKNGKWILGNKDHCNGKWGNNVKKLGEVYDLNFNDVDAIFSPDAFIGRIIDIHGIKVLDFTLNYTTEGFGTFDHSTQGVTVTQNKKYYNSINYYFVKTDDENLKIREYFNVEVLFNSITENLKTYKVKRWTSGGLNSAEGDIDFDYGGGTTFQKINKNKWIDALNFGIKAGKANEKHKKLLEIIKSNYYDSKETN